MLRYLPHLLRYRVFGIFPDQRLVALHNYYAGKRCFILGNGPSLLKRNLSPLAGEVTFAANGLFRKFDELGFAPTFFCQVDKTQAEDWEDELAALSGFTRFVALKNSYAHPLSSEIVVLNGLLQKDDDRTRPRFSLDAASQVYHCKTVTFIALQLAYYMGFSEVYLVGMDHSFGKLARMFPPGDLVINEQNIDLVEQQHFSPGYYKIGDRIGIPDMGMIESGYSVARDIFARDGRKVFNATDGGELEVFERIAFDDIAFYAS